MAKKFPASFHCATEFTLSVLGGKWKTVILCYLKQRPCRYSQLRKLTSALSDKVLTERLRELETAGLIVHRDGTYALTAKAESLGPVLAHLYAWGHENAQLYGVAVGEPLAALADQR